MPGQQKLGRRSRFGVQTIFPTNVSLFPAFNQVIMNTIIALVTNLSVSCFLTEQK